jgi:hypothetical protein
MNEWIFRSLLKYACTIGVDEFEKIHQDQLGRLIKGGGRQLTSTAHGGKSATYSFPAGFGSEQITELMDKVSWFLANYPCDSEECANYLQRFPDRWARARYNVYWP